MTQDEPTSAPPEFTVPAPPSGTPKSHHRIRWILAAVLVAGVVAGAILAISNGKSKPKIHVNGTIIVTINTEPVPPATRSDIGTPCITMPGGAVKYGGITRDAEVAISDDAGDAVLQTTKLSGGTFGSNGSCVFTFTTSVPSGTHLYDIKVGLGRDAPTFKFTESEMANPKMMLM